MTFDHTDQEDKKIGGKIIQYVFLPYTANSTGRFQYLLARGKKMTLVRKKENLR
jgi:hypothetical protein